MQIKITGPDGTIFEYKKEPMDKDKFNTICALIGTYIVGSGILEFVSILTGR